MSTRDPFAWMWANALQMLDRAERVQNRFFEVSATTAQQPSWEPPIDVFETPGELYIVAALPGVDSGSVTIAFEGRSCVIGGVRDLPFPKTVHGAIRRLEIPYGRFERRMELPEGHYELRRRDLVAGCLRLQFRKL